MALGSNMGTLGQRKPYQRGLGMPAQPGQTAMQQANVGMAQQIKPPQPVTQAGGLAQQKNLQSLQSGQFGEVQSAGNAANRANALRQYQAIQLSRGNAARGNLSTEQAQRGQDEALAAANSSNLAATNSVNALQRQYGQDALNRADTYENQAYSRGRDAIGDERYTDETQYSRGRDAVSDQRYDTEYSDSRGDVAYSRNYQEGRDAVGDQRYDQSYADTRGDVQYSRDYQQSRDAVGDTRYSDETQYSRGRDQVGDERYASETAYSQSRDAIGDQRYDATTAYNQGRDTVADQRYATEYQDQRGDTLYNRGEAQRLEGKGDTNALIASVQDPRAQNLLRGAQARGEDVQALYNQIIGTGTDQAGTIGEQYRSASPGEAAYQAKVDELKQYTPRKTDPTDPDGIETEEQYEARISDLARKQYQTEQAAVNQPVSDAANQQNKEAAAQRLANGTPQPGDFNTLPSVTPQAIPLGVNTAKFLAESTTGGWTKIGGTPYKVVSGGRTVTRKGDAFSSDRHADHAVLQDESGKTMYLLASGEITATKPVGKKG